jgi:ribonuclease P protein component
MLGRIVRSADFQLVLSSPAKARSAHFAAHHVSFASPLAKSLQTALGAEELSTSNSEPCTQPVDEIGQARDLGHRLGIVVPKRHARRAATRNLLRRQIRAVMSRHERQLASGLWVVRLRAPFARSEFVAATSTALRVAAREELDSLFMRVSH